jgi:exodeoxyribonuclease VII small subunit
VSKSRQLTYSQALKELESIISEIESEEVNVDTLTEKVKRATYLITFCKGRLKSTDEEVRKVLSGLEDSPESDVE